MSRLSPSLQAALQLWAKMTLEQGTLDDEGRRLLHDLLAIHAPQADLSELLNQVRDLPSGELINRVSCYEDRFFIAMNAFAAQTLTGPATEDTATTFGSLVKAFALQDDDVCLLKNTVQNRPNASLPPRVESLYAGSSFYRAA
ncbi:hypothetical protein [Acanthopleuribacter pedis]|uniref:Uncharacterized protein n=1 Tax=Acanthopleuribacter pedis TaxID=442870 RepID=A0A8J7Q721_9BACT|nr:hypothetical protein [Acanthopleuribacter pedis]MBO1317959.1 hypothetical protein [Acanthopleuribacter pedis]